jgi:hypothetical protein
MRIVLNRDTFLQRLHGLMMFHKEFHVKDLVVIALPLMVSGTQIFVKIIQLFRVVVSYPTI